MSIPKEPRQIMINLMYLVLTALLALNVSNEILNAFKVLSKGISDSNAAIDSKTIEQYNAIKANEQEPGQADKVRPYRERADAIVTKSNELWKYFEDWKGRVVAQAGGYTIDGKDTAIKAEGDIDATTTLLVEKKGGDTVKQKIESLREFMLAQVGTEAAKVLGPFMPLKVAPVKPTDNNPHGDWSIGYFEHMPTVAALAMFSKFQNDVRSSEALVIKSLFEQAHLKDIKFDTIAAIAVPHAVNVLAGQKVEADILLAAFNKSNKPTVTMSGGGGSVKPAVNGVVPWEGTASGTGLQTVSGNITLNTERGPQSRPWKFQYTIGSTGASMQLDKMNVFYIGVQNPITVSAAGYSLEDVSVKIDAPGATVTPGAEKGKYNVTVTNTGKVMADIMAKTQSGAMARVGGMEVRVKTIPDPVAEVGAQQGGRMSAAIFKAQLGVVATLKGFDFDIKFSVYSFILAILPKRGEYIGPFTATSNLFSANTNMQKAINNAKPGDRVFIEEVKARGPDNKPRVLNSVILTLF